MNVYMLDFSSIKNKLQFFQFFDTSIVKFLLELDETENPTKKQRKVQI